MRQIILLAHISLDGFVAGPDGELDGFEPGEENLAFVCQLTETADAALFGRVSYQLLEYYWPTAKDKPNATKSEIAYSNWYNSAHKIVFSRTLTSEGLHNTTIINRDILDTITLIKEQPGKDILIFGSPSVTQALMQLELVDSYWIFVNPALFGQGIPLFTASPYQTKLQLTASQQFANGELALHYIAKQP